MSHSWCGCSGLELQHEYRLLERRQWHYETGTVGRARTDLEPAEADAAAPEPEPAEEPPAALSGEPDSTAVEGERASDPELGALPIDLRFLTHGSR